MGRIDEALRRARVPMASHNTERSGNDVFVSVWDTVAPTDWGVQQPEVKRRSSHELGSDQDAGGSVLLASIDGIDSEWREKLAITTSNQAVVNQFRRLAGVLVQAQRARPLKTILITSAMPGDGKTLTSLNLGLVLSESYRRRVVLIEADFRRPRIGSVINLPITDGLSDVMKAP